MIKQFAGIVVCYIGIGPVMLRRQLPLASEREQNIAACLGGGLVALGAAWIIKHL